MAHMHLYLLPSGTGQTDVQSDDGYQRLMSPHGGGTRTRSSADGHKPAQRVYRSDEVTKHGTIRLLGMVSY